MINILEYLENAYEKYGKSPAFSDDDTTLSFEDIYRKARAIGSCLISRGLYKKPVIVFMGKKPDTIAAFMGVVYAGCYYVPIDYEMPKQRISLIVEKLDKASAVTDEDPSVLKDYEFGGGVIDYNEACSYAEDSESLDWVRKRAVDTDPIYIVFTSGSTGVPKGVIACHRSVIDYMNSFTDVIGVTEKTVFGMQVPLYVDACLKEVFSTLKCGARTWMIKKTLFMFPTMLVKYLNDHQINTLCWVVSALTLISGLGAFKKTVPQYLKTIAFGSEVFPVKQLNLWREYVPEARYINLYGPTEATGMSCYYELPAGKVYEENDVIPVGRPFKNTDVFLLDENDREAIEGEICIRGTALTLGYFNDERTRDVFVQNPLNSMYPELIYRTGDIGRFDMDGNLVFVSRKDAQIKHMGYRIELGEIESAAAGHENVTQVCCVYDSVKSRIIMYYSGSAEAAEVTAYMKKHVPVYMMPQSMVRLDRMPLTDNGKIDRAGLKKKALSK